MPLKYFNSKTFVAFIDISGFKKKLQSNKNEAINTLKNFFNAGYKSLKDNQNISGIFVSDCGILYSKKEDGNPRNKLEELLNAVKAININSIQYNIMLTTNIAYGDFLYQSRRELNNLKKNLLTGNAYVNAYLDSSKMKKVTHCRIVDNDIPNNLDIMTLKNYIIEKENKYYYYYWQLNNPNDLFEFKKEFKDRNKLDKNERFRKILLLTKKFLDKNKNIVL
jgi:hypothetical protein